MKYYRRIIVLSDLRPKVYPKKGMANEEWKRKSQDLRNREARVVRDIQVDL